MRNIGMRVGAIAKADENTVTFFGYGIYAGDEVPPADIGLGFPNPKILLDTGEVVWGCECWWGPEAKVRQIIGERPINQITPQQYRTQPVNPAGGR